MEAHSDSGGWLAIVSSPIGNLEDITYRAIRTLTEADVIAAEDTRRAKRLLERYEINGRLTSYHLRNEHGKTASLIRQVQSGTKLALLSDAGTPCISDPGFLLVRDAVKAGIEPLVIPGVSALTYAAVAAALPVDHFTFAGFLPPKGERRRKKLRELSKTGTTLFLYESPYRIHKLLDDVVAVLGDDCDVVLAREATKRYEEHIRGKAGELVSQLRDRKFKGEFTVALYSRQPLVENTD